MIPLKNKTCLEHHPICKASCCRQFHATSTEPLQRYVVPGFRNKAYRIPFTRQCNNYYQLRKGCIVRKDIVYIFKEPEVIKTNDDKYRHTWHITCDALGDDYLCTLYNKPNRPIACGTPGSYSDYESIAPKDCIYEDNT